jgi:hypothetical protein
MKRASELLRNKFRRLAILEIDPAAILEAEEHSDKIDLLLQAVQKADAIFWRQVIPDVTPESLLQQAGTDDELKEMLLFNYGPYDRLNNDESLLSAPKKPPGAGFYPADLTREAFIHYLQQHHESKAELESPYTIVRRANTHLTAIPFHQAYKDLVDDLSSLLSKAAALEVDPSFGKFLAQRARDLRSDDFYASDGLWVNLTDNPIDLVIGPYEVYEDKLMGLKAAYEAFLLKRNFEESAKVQHFQHDLPRMCASLESQLGRSLPVDGHRVRMSVADLAYAGGDAHKAIPAIAFNLPNDERITEELGARQIILRNVLEAKFQLVGWEILKRVLQTPPKDKEVAFQNFFTFTLFHEIAHAVGPHRILKNGEQTTVNRCLRQHYSILEEAKADTLGACLTLKATSKIDVPIFLATYVGGLLRPIRFGFAEAHGGSNTIQFNYLSRAGAITVDVGVGKISINQAKVGNALGKLAADILNIQESGDFDAAERLVADFRVIGPDLQELIRRTADLPIDIRIRFSRVDTISKFQRFDEDDLRISRHDAESVRS